MSTNQLNRKLLRRAWDIAWPHKHLWIFGFLATFAGFGGVSEIYFRSYSRVIDVTASLSGAAPLINFPGAEYFWAAISVSSIPLVTALVLGSASIALLAVAVWIITISIAALIRSCDRLGRGIGDVHFNEGVKFGLPRFWPIFVTNLASKFIILVAASLTGSALFVFIKDNDWMSAGLFVTSFVIFIGLAIIVATISIYATIESAIHGTPSLMAIERATKLFAKNWLVSLETALLVLGINVIFAGATVLIAALVAVPFILIFLLAAGIGAQSIITSTIVLGLSAALVVAIGFVSLLTTMQTAIWTLLWDELNKRRPLPLIGRVIGWALKKMK